MRFQEHYESPKFRNKIFSRDEYREWYIEYTNKLSFTYYSDWSGFNIPSYVLLPFFSGAFTELTNREREFLQLFKNCTGQYYIIGCKKGNKLTLKHELMHALYYTNNLYRNNVNQILTESELVPIIKPYLIKLGYHKEVIIDEVHAYLVTCKEKLTEANINVDQYKHYIKLLDKNYKKYSKL